MSRRGWVLFAAMCVIWGVPYLLIRVAVREVSPATLVFARTAIAALVLVPLAGVRGELRPMLPHWRVLGLYTLVEVAGPWLLLSHAETRLSSSLAGLLVAAVPLIGAVAARLVGADDRVGGRRLVGLVVGLGGVVALLGLDLGEVNALAVGEVGLTAAGYAIGPLIIARSLADLPSIGVVATSLAATAIVYAPVAATQLPAHLSGEVAASVIVLGLLCTALAFLLFFALIAEVGPTRSVVITYINPAVAVVLGVVLLGESFTIGMAVGFPLVLLGSVLATRRAGTPAVPPATAETPASSGVVAVPEP